MLPFHRHLISFLTFEVGPTYRGDEVFNLASMQPYNLRAIYEPFYRLTKDIVLYLPRTSDLNELAAYVPEDCKIAVTHYCLSGFSKVSYLFDSICDASLNLK